MPSKQPSGKLRFAQQSAASAFAIDDGSGAAEVQVNGRDGIVLQFLGRAHERRDVVADHLGDDRPAGGILRDGIQDPLFQVGNGVDAKVFGPVNIRSAVTADHAHEFQRGDILHGRQREHGGRCAQQGGKCFVGGQIDFRMRKCACEAGCARSRTRGKVAKFLRSGKVGTEAVSYFGVLVLPRRNISGTPTTKKKAVMPKAPNLNLKKAMAIM